MPQQQMAMNASQEKVFNYLSDLSKHGEWGNPSQKLHVEKTSDGPIGQGSTFRSTGEQFGKQEDTVTITEYAPNQRVVYESQGKAGVLRHTIEITPSDDGVTVTKGFEIVKAGFPFMLFVPIVTTFIAPGAIRSDLERIKARVEGS
jgi:uncharacterized protein YndB with AHSA1/START domain